MTIFQLSLVSDFKIFVAKNHSSRVLFDGNIETLLESL